MPIPLPPVATSRGNLRILDRHIVAIFSSSRCPGDLIVRTYDFIRAIDDPNLAMAGGFHSPIEEECLTLLLRNSQPVIICPARAISTMRLRPQWREPFDVGRVLLLSVLPDTCKRITGHSSEVRNHFVASIAGEILIPHAAPGSKTEAFCRKLIQAGKPVSTFESPANAHLIRLGAQPVEPV
jgi:predicted Rossmann fold nucleotide-binding protein DprA/Smf involved in DNA uptake